MPLLEGSPRVGMKSVCHNQDPGQPKINKYFLKGGYRMVCKYIPPFMLFFLNKYRCIYVVCMYAFVYKQFSERLYMKLLMIVSIKERR